jgi:hypothetical protein
MQFSEEMSEWTIEMLNKKIRILQKPARTLFFEPKGPGQKKQ